MVPITFRPASAMTRLIARLQPSLRMIGNAVDSYVERRMRNAVSPRRLRHADRKIRHLRRLMTARIGAGHLETPDIKSRAA
jgi:hypothetical protein